MTRTALVTGGTRGVGLETARALVARGYRVLLTARDEVRGRAVVGEIGGGEVLRVDLERPVEVVALAEEVGRRTDRLDLLVDNAGAVFTTRDVTPDGFERTWALNHLAYFALTTRLVPLLRASAPARVVVLSSGAHQAGILDWDDLQRTRWTGSGWPAYCQSKLANLLFVRELVRRLDGTGITVNAIHPGFVASGFARNNGWLLRTLMRLGAPFGRTPAKGAETVIWAATDPDLATTTGAYFSDCKPRTPSARALDDPAAARLWSVSEDQLQPLIGATPGFGS